MLVVNAANAAKAYAWIVEQAKAVGEAAVVDSSARYALIAVQGPAALDTVQPLTGADLSSLRNYGFTYGEVAQARALISRTGYTGEDGFEIYVPPNMADRVWQALLQAGAAAGVIPCGLGARDTLRLEAAMRLYGQDIDDTTTPLEAGLGGLRRLGEAVVPRGGPPAGAARPPAWDARWSASRSRIAASPATATPC